MWIHRINVIAPVNNTTEINSLWTVIAPNGNYEAESFGVQLSPTGNDPATHTGISTAATEHMRLLIVDTYEAELTGAIISIQPADENDWTELLIANGLNLIETEVI